MTIPADTDPPPLRAWQPQETAAIARAEAARFHRLNPASTDPVAALFYIRPVDETQSDVLFAAQRGDAHVQRIRHGQGDQRPETVEFEAGPLSGVVDLALGWPA